MAAYRKGIVGLGKAYGATDAFGKTILFFNELDGLKKLFLIYQKTSFVN